MFAHPCCRWETTILTVAYSTPVETIEELRLKINDYIDTNSRDWSGFALNIDKMDNQNALHLIVAIEREYIRLHTIIGEINKFCRPTKLAGLGW